MQKKADLIFLVGLTLFTAIFLVAVKTVDTALPIKAESRVAIIFSNSINENNFVGATEGAQRILNTMVNIADFAVVKNKVINSGFAVTDNIFDGSAKENAEIWKKYVSIEPVNGAFVLKIKTGGRNSREAKELAGVIAHEVVLEIPELFTNLRGLSDQPRQVSYQWVADIFWFLGTLIVIAYVIILWKIFNQKKKEIPLSVKSVHDNPVVSDKKPDRDPRYFLQKFLEEHQKH